MPIILGIDPGTTDVGFAVIELQKNQRTILTYGVIHTTPKAPQTQKLVEIMKDLDVIIQQYNVTHAAIEKLFFSTNLKTGIDVAQSRGVIMVTIGNHDIPILEYTPLQVKKAICGNGKAEKKQIGRAVQLLFKLDTVPKPDDAADALGIAYLASMNPELYLKL
ncbi:crossover junction endodeoxyribonuclease RuvC [Candidatus Gracilibacteria bacterium]|nr:crossover junction endodeoxyribonuclease RuvC [Candidatus Gracilibacteria bacterium]